MDPFTESLKTQIANLLGPRFGELIKKLQTAEYPWHLLDILEKVENPFGNERMGKVHPLAVIEGNVHVASGAVIEPFTVIKGPAFIGPNATIGPDAFIRPTTIIGANCIVRTSHVKNSIVLNESKIAHYSYCGESIVSKGCNFGAGSQTADLRLDERKVRVMYNGILMDTGRRKFGCIFEPGVRTALATMLNPGTVVKEGALLLGSRDYKGVVEKKV